MEIDDRHGTVYMERAFKKTKKQTPAIFGNTIEKKKKFTRSCLQKYPYTGTTENAAVLESYSVTGTVLFFIIIFPK